MRVDGLRKYGKGIVMPYFVLAICKTEDGHTTGARLRDMEGRTFDNRIRAEYNAAWIYVCNAER